jgi:Major intrinsic protein
MGLLPTCSVIAIDLWPGVRMASRANGDSGGAHRLPRALAKSLRRAGHRLNPKRVPQPLPRPERAALHRLLANTIATGAALVALILTFGPISGAHFNPAVTLADASQGGLSWGEVPLYLGAQAIGAFAGVATAHVMFEMPVFFASRHSRSGPAQVFSAFVAKCTQALPRKLVPTRAKETQRRRRENLGPRRQSRLGNAPRPCRKSMTRASR